ncbi:hypothetical protein GCM10011297_28870 [Bacterioplanes sanyensis]|uniref:hypothetical protein n=1 Tax=Bacterioplanes sanyensis TaxID=1249553 RepID=UPI0016740188|nr:hypothetical protein [Bacterioplanes sanyensis]GGY54210.1 hypothetical protein GCM10011297_28870 [Bacterioplanes sanyensis]
MKHPASTHTLPATGSGCGLRPDPEALSDDVGFDFSAAKALKPATTDGRQQQKSTNNSACPAYTER